MGLGQVGLQPDRLAVRGDRPGPVARGLQGEAEVGVGLGESGFLRIASRYSAMAPGRSPESSRAKPRL